MPRYIDADALKEQMEFVCMGIMAGTDPYNAPLETIDDAPTADVVEIVRCKDCKHHTEEDPGMVYCPHIVGGWESMFHFCSHGEKRDDE